MDYRHICSLKSYQLHKGQRFERSAFQLPSHDCRKASTQRWSEAFLLYHDDHLGISTRQGQDTPARVLKASVEDDNSSAGLTPTHRVDRKLDPLQTSTSQSEINMVHIKLTAAALLIATTVFPAIAALPSGNESKMPYAKPIKYTYRVS